MSIVWAPLKYLFYLGLIIHFQNEYITIHSMTISSLSTCCRSQYRDCCMEGALNFFFVF